MCQQSSPLSRSPPSALSPIPVEQPGKASLWTAHWWSDGSSSLAPWILSKRAEFTRAAGSGGRGLICCMQSSPVAGKNK
ncbi:unnamed protein product [Fusarium venenatum]|uniref:Uncharacterized protein n=1 Tax=Fusarium venenatum TaxID=56646 RepID=A0A2L2TFI6_9HYPO|nr:uncharacterized protein FVRRES_11788 [Fusarium venenatum]CEI39097.1 unnamed protein product [Fusarium venenatum]